MGKNQTHKAMQRGRSDSSSAAPEEIEDGMVDGSFHSPEWHAARLASLKTSHTVTWEEFKKKQKEDEMKRGEVEADKDRMMQEYRAQLDAERASKLSHGRNHSGSKSNHKADRKEKEIKRSISKRKKRSKRRHSESSSSSSSDSESSSSDDEERHSKRTKSSRSKRRKKEKKHKSRRKADSSSDGKEIDNGPVRLSSFFGC